MSTRQIALLALGCCTVLSCESTSKPQVAQGVAASLDAPPSGEMTLHETGPSQFAVPHRFVADMELLRDHGAIEEMPLVNVGRIDDRAADLAVEVESPRDPVRIALDMQLVGGGPWLERFARGLEADVASDGDCVLIESSAPEMLEASLRKAVRRLHAAMDRIRADLAAAHTPGHHAALAAWEHRFLTNRPADADDPDALLCEFTRGRLVETGRDTDLAIDGDGLFVLRSASDAATREIYTRVVSLLPAPDGTLRLRRHPDARLHPEITLPDHAAPVRITADGRVRARTLTANDAAPIGRLTLVRFERPDRLERIAPGLYAATDAAGACTYGTPGQDAFGTVRQGFTEQHTLDAERAAARLRRLEDARRITLAMIDALRHPAPNTDAIASGRQTPRGNDPAIDDMVRMPRPMARPHELEPTLLAHLARQGVATVIGNHDIHIVRSARSAAALADYLRYLHARLDAIADNIAHANDALDPTDGRTPYRRKIVRLGNDGTPRLARDAAPFRIVREIEPADPQTGLPSRRSVIYPNVDIDRELADANAAAYELSAVVDALCDLGEHAARVLVDILHNESDRLRLDAADMLRRIGPAAVAAVPALIELQFDAEWPLQRRITAALFAIAPDHPSTIEATLRTYALALNQPDPQQRYEAAVAIGRMGAHAAPLVPLLIDRLDDPTTGAAVALADIGPAASDAVPALIAMLHHPDAHTRAQSAFALGRMRRHAAPALPALQLASLDDDADVRRQVRAALAAIHRTNRPAGHVTTATIREWIECLAAIGLHIGVRRSLPLSPLTPHHAIAWDAVILRAACAGIARLGPLAAAAQPSLEQLTRHADPHVAAAAIRALAVIQYDAASAVADISLALASPNPTVRHCAVQALGAIGPAAAPAVPALMAQLATQDHAVQVVVIESLARIGESGRNTVRALQRLAGAPDAELRMAAHAALATITGDETQEMEPVDGPPRTLAGSADADAHAP